jgi:hypothetical protein
MPKTHVIPVPKSIPSDKTILAVDETITDLGLTVTMRGSLKSCPGSTHWHLKRGCGRGTLEITWWPQRRKLWIKIQAGRTAAWIDEIAPQFKERVARCLRDPARSA